MSTFQVFLPPIRLIPLDKVSASDVPLAFHTIPKPPNFDPASQSLGKEESFLGRLLSHPTTIDKKGKRKADDSIDDVSDEEQDYTRQWMQDSEIVEKPRAAVLSRNADIKAETSRDGARRRSNRLLPADLLNALPALQPNDSILSLNTTISNPSQLPPSASAETSMYNLPKWTISISRLSRLDKLLRPSSKSTKQADSQEGKVTLIVCVTGTTPAMVRKRKEERARGQDGTLWIAKWDVVAQAKEAGKEVGCEVVLWDKCARDHGDTVRRGDVILLENVEFRPPSRRDKAQLILSPSFPQPRPIVLYRTLPRYTTKSDYIRASPRHQNEQHQKILPEDKAMRPDLRVGRSDPGVRRVAETARWFAEWVGGQAPP